MDDTVFRRVIYRSTARNGERRDDLAQILAQSRRNNGLDGVSGLLWSDGTRYVQLLEGPPESVALTLARIVADPRHEGVEIISDQMVDDRAFGDWSMANLPGDRRDEAGERLAHILLRAPDDVRRVFEALR